MNKKILICIVFVIAVSVIFREYNKKENVIVSYNGNNLLVSVDGKEVKKIPTDGKYYLSSYSCQSKSTKVSWNMDKHELSVSNGNKRGNVSCYLEFETHPKLSKMKVGSYVKYVGNNGCEGDSCLGKVSDGYCGSGDNKYLFDGYRIAYIGDNTVYLISAGATFCSDKVDDIGSISLKYCNKDYVLGGICNNNVVWSMNSMDFRMITKSSITDVLCINKPGDRGCGYNNDLIDIGGSYYIYVNNSLFGWDAGKRVFEDKIDSSYGIRPVIRLDNNVVVTSGNGSYDDPYIIGNNTFWVNGGSTIISKDKDKVELSLMSVDASKMCVSVNTSVCNNYVDYVDSYILDLSKEDNGDKLIYVYYKDVKDRIIASVNRSITLE